MTGFVSVARAMVKGYIRDGQSVFFTIVFPLMFLVLFGAIFTDPGPSKFDVAQVGPVTLLDRMPPQVKQQFESTFTVTEVGDRAEAVQQVKDGDQVMALWQQGNRIVVRYSAADQVQSAQARGTLSGFVQGANLAVLGKPPTFTMSMQQVEDQSLQTIQYVTPGLLGWAVAMSASFGAAATLTGWRQTKLLRRLRLAPISSGALITARTAVTIGIALVQMAIFLGLATAFFGLQLSGTWWLTIPLLLCGTLSFMALGLLAGSLAKTVEGAANLANVFVLPMAFLSGSFFPLEGAPAWLQVVSQLMPLRHLNDGMLDVMVRGQGVGAIVVPAAILLGFAAVVVLIASRFFRWETD